MELLTTALGLSLALHSPEPVAKNLHHVAFASLHHVVLENAGDSGAGLQRREHRPTECRVTSGVCGLPLGAKIGLAVVLSWFAWGCLFAAYDCLTLRPRDVRKGLRDLACAVGLWGLCAIAWFWGGAY